MLRLTILCTRLHSPLFKHGLGEQKSAGKITKNNVLHSKNDKSSMLTTGKFAVVAAETGFAQAGVAMKVASLALEQATDEPATLAAVLTRVWLATGFLDNGGDAELRLGACRRRWGSWKFPNCLQNKYLPTYLLTYLSNLLTYLPTYVSTFVTYLPTYLIYISTHLSAYLPNVYLPNYLSIYWCYLIIYLLTYILIYLSSMYLLTYRPTYLRT